MGVNRGTSHSDFSLQPGAGSVGEGIWGRLLVHLFHSIAGGKRSGQNLPYLIGSH
jgi:hypothetical protein